MESINVSRFVLGFVLSVLFAVGVHMTAPTSFADCSQPGNNGGCKKAPTPPEVSDPAAPSDLGGLLNQLGIVLSVMRSLY